MRKLKRGSDTGYRITDTGEGYYEVVISDINANETRYYEYSGTFETLEEVEKYLKRHTYEAIVKHYREMWVYCECVEQIY